VFSIDLPVRQVASPGATAPLQGMRVRLVEADPKLFAQYAHWLHHMGGVCVSGDAGAPQDALVVLSEADEPAPCADLAPCIHLVKPLMPAELQAALGALRQRPSHNKIFVAADNAPPLRKLTGLRALLVEDDPVNRLVSEASLRHAGMEVCTSADGHQALAMFRHQPFDVVLTDLRLPCIDGLEVARAMRRIERERGTRCAIVALSASVMPQDRAGCIDAGMDDFLAKPIAKELLYESLARHVQRR
jgi:CheY-like chemotaxis protein